MTDTLSFGIILDFWIFQKLCLSQKM